MSTLKEMAREYRVASAKIARRVREMSERGGDAAVIASLKTTLIDMRAIQRLLDSYYELSRDPDFTCSSLKTVDHKQKDDG